MTTRCGSSFQPQMIIVMMNTFQGWENTYQEERYCFRSKAEAWFLVSKEKPFQEQGLARRGHNQSQLRDSTSPEHSLLDGNYGYLDLDNAVMTWRDGGVDPVHVFLGSAASQLKLILTFFPSFLSSSGIILMLQWNLKTMQSNGFCDDKTSLCRTSQVCVTPSYFSSP